MQTLINHINNFNALLLDQYGVLHDGTKPYPHALTLLNALAQKQIPTALITNSGKSAQQNAQRLKTIGIPPQLLTKIITSGDITLNHLKQKIQNGTLKPHTPCFVISRGNPQQTIQNLPISQTNNPNQAELILILGSETDIIPMTSYQQQLQLPAKLKIPCICANPDDKMITPSGIKPGPGAIAKLYLSMGGPTLFIGKPHPKIYHETLKQLNLKPGKHVCCVGDSFQHDILGGYNAQLTTCLVLTGLSQNLSQHQIKQKCQNIGTKPDLIVNSLA